MAGGPSVIVFSYSSARGRVMRVLGASGLQGCGMSVSAPGCPCPWFVWRCMHTPRLGVLAPASAPGA